MTPARGPLQWRAYQPGDAAALAALFRASIEALAASHYDAAQRAAWAASADDLGGFATRLARGTTLVALADDEPVAFGQLHPHDHVEMLYTAPGWARQGLATALLARLEALARAAGAPLLTSDASEVSESVFRRAGFMLVAPQTVQRDGVSLRRFHLCKSLQPATPTP